MNIETAESNLSVTSPSMNLIKKPANNAADGAKQAHCDKALRESEEKYQLLLDGIRE